MSRPARIRQIYERGSEGSQQNTYHRGLHHLEDFGGKGSAACHGVEVVVSLARVGRRVQEATSGGELPASHLTTTTILILHLPIEVLSLILAYVFES